MQLELLEVKMNKLNIEWKSEDHIKLADIYMDAEDNISCYDGCLESSFQLIKESPEEAIEMLGDKSV